MNLIKKTYKFIINKWNIDYLYDLYPIPKKLFYFPDLINRILTLFFYFLIFPLVCLNVYYKEKLYMIIPYLNLYIWYKMKSANIS